MPVILSLAQKWLWVMVVGFIVFVLHLFFVGWCLTLVYVQLSGPQVDAMAYAEWVKKDLRFSSIFIQVSPCLHHHAFPRLKLRYKPSLVQVRICLFGFHWSGGWCLTYCFCTAVGLMCCSWLHSAGRRWDCTSSCYWPINKSRTPNSPAMERKTQSKSYCGHKWFFKIEKSLTSRCTKRYIQIPFSLLSPLESLQSHIGSSPLHLYPICYFLHGYWDCSRSFHFLPLLTLQFFLEAESPK